MTYQEAVAYIGSFTWSSARLGLQRTGELLSRLGDPQKKLQFLHVAGSNGKGSTCCMLSGVLTAAGYKTGLYTSPHIQDFRERFQIDGAVISPRDLADVTQAVRAAADAMEDHPSQFELSTAIAMEWFARQGCRLVVLEVGMGGELDSTNVIDPPLVAVITNIGLEHTEYLGSTLEEIARTKAGIVKTGCSCVCYRGEDAVTRVVEEVCRQRQVPFFPVDPARLTPLTSDLSGQSFLWDGQPLRLPLLGRHQLSNAATALTALEVLRDKGFSLPPQAVARGLAGLSWPARLEVLSREPLFLLDGGHNPQCAQALHRELAHLFPDEKVCFLTGVLADKDYPAMMEALCPHARRFFCLTPDSPRALPAEELCAFLTARGLEASPFSAPEEALQAALQTGEPTVAFGSLYLAGQIRSALPPLLKRYWRERCLAGRASLSPAERREKSLAISRHLIDLPALRQAGTILSYRAVGDEVDLAPFHAWALAQGKQLAFPFCAPGGDMEALLPADSQAWTDGLYGIPAPDPLRARPVPPSQVDAVILPCVGFDRAGGRLGRGGGYYDRYLPRCPQARRVLAAFAAQELAQVPREGWDMPAHTVLTEEGPLTPDTAERGAPA